MKALLFLLPCLPVFGQMLYVGSGDSMLPTFQAGQQFLVYPVAWEKLQVGDVIVFTAHDGKATTCHRIVQKFPWGIATKGDNNKTWDRWLVTRKRYIGKAIPVK